MKKRAYDFKQQALGALRGNWFIAIIAGFIASLLGGLTFGGGGGGSSSSSDSGSSGGGSGSGGDINVPIEEFEAMLKELLSNEIVIAIFAIMAVLMVVLTVLSLVRLIIGGAIGVGYSRFNLDLIEGRGAKLSTVFGSFKQLVSALVARILRSIYVTLWTLLFIIPGIIANFSYSMVHYVMADNPEMGANEAIAESKRLMKGNKWRLFCLCFSFIGWELLALIFTLGIGMLWVVPYEEAAIAAFYRDICPKKEEGDLELAA